MDLDSLKSKIAAFHRGKKWIVLPDAAAGATSMVEQLRDWGVGGVMIVAAVEGVGELPIADRFFYTRTRGSTVMLGIRAYLASVEHPSDELLAAVDEFDPSGDAKVLGSGFSRMGMLAGRPVYGARPPEWGALEDKTLVDQLWDDAGVRRAPSAVVPVGEAAAVAADLASELGTVWVADNREGWHGGGEYARWVRSESDVGPAAAWMAQHADTVRIMPFLDGIPSSIHGFVTPDGVAVFLPMEMIILRNAERPEFLYAQAANFWSPPADVRDGMRESARRVGTLLADRYGYLGGFGIDGVCTADGFLPTELNPRLSVGHGLQSRAADVPLGSIERMMIAGDVAIASADLEAIIVDAAESGRRGGMLLPLTASYEAAKTGIVLGENGAVAVDPEGQNDAVMEIGPAAMGSVIVLRLDPEHTPIGPSTAPRAVHAIDLARDLWDLEIPRVVAAPDVCSPAGR